MQAFDTKLEPGQGGPTRRLEMPDIFAGAEKNTRPASATILAEPARVYEFLRNFENHTWFTEHVARVTAEGPRIYAWLAEGRGGRRTEWKTEILDERPGEMIAWRTVAGGPFEQLGAWLVEPAVGGRGTIVSLKVVNNSTLGKLVGALEKLGLADPDSEALRTVRRLKAFMETGEVPTTVGQPSGRSEDSAEERVA